jgi:hypothetical protein
MKIITEDRNRYFDQYSVEYLSLAIDPYQDKGQSEHSLKRHYRAFEELFSKCN